MHSKSIFLAASLAISQVAAWGAVGHQTVALVAKNYLTPATKTWVNGLLGKQSMEEVASWADSYRYTKGGAWSGHLHYIDANDSPPHSCGVDFDRDCSGSGCIVTAIMNYTSLVTDTKRSATVQSEALKFLIHFFGDITQPLHCEALEVGGNRIDIKWGKGKTNLHSCWDRNIPEKIAGGGSMDSSVSWSKKIIKEIDSGSYKSQAQSWTKCNDTTKAKECAMSWAADSNFFVCRDVIHPTLDNITHDPDLSKGYYEDNKDIVQVQIAKGGYRLAAWLNELAAKQKKNTTPLNAWEILS